MEKLVSKNQFQINHASHLNITLNKNKSCTSKFEDLFWILKEKKMYKVKGKKLCNQMASKAKSVELTVACIEAFSDVVTTQSNI